MFSHWPKCHRPVSDTVPRHLTLLTRGPSSIERYAITRHWIFHFTLQYSINVMDSTYINVSWFCVSVCLVTPCWLIEFVTSKMCCRIVTVKWVWYSEHIGVQYTGTIKGTTDLFLRQNLQAGYGPHPSSYLMDITDFFQSLSGRGVKLTSLIVLLLTL